MSQDMQALSVILTQNNRSNILQYTEQQLRIHQLIDSEFNSSDTGEVGERLSTIQFLASISKSALSKIAKTFSKHNNYEEGEIVTYIDDVLSNGFHYLIPTRLADNEALIDAQKLKWWSTIIAERVELSDFSTNKFKSKTLRLQRSAIAQSKTLHALRQAVNAMIGPLSLLREHEALLEATSPEQRELEDAESRAYTEGVLLELEGMTKLAAERKRVLDELLKHYDEGMSEMSLLRNCEEAKKDYNLSDTDVAKMFGLSRNKLLSLRANIVLS